MKNKVSNKRWKLAQSFEKKLWDSMPEKEILENSKYYSEKLDFLLEELRKKIRITKKTKFLQIGCGPDDIINKIKIGKRCSIDPLADFYKSKFNINYKDTNLIRGVGEKLPYPDNYFDVIILANVLDHTKNAEKVLSEVKRVLNKNGIFYVECHFYQKNFLTLSKVYGFFKRKFTKKIFNPCHPHMLSLLELKKLIKRYFIIYSEISGKDIEKEIYTLEDLKKFLKKEKFTRRFPAIFGLYGVINYTCFCKKK